MQNRKPNHHDDLSVVELKAHHDEMEQNALDALLQNSGNDFMSQIKTQMITEMFGAEDNDIHTVQDARVADLNKVLEAKTDQDRNVEANNKRNARGEKKYGLFSTVVEPVVEAVSREASPSVLRASK